MEIYELEKIKINVFRKLSELQKHRYLDELIKTIH